MRHILVTRHNKQAGLMLKNKIESELSIPVICVRTHKETLDVLNRKELHISEAVLDYQLEDAPNGEIIKSVVSKGIPSLLCIDKISPETRKQLWSGKVTDYILTNDPNGTDYITHALKRFELNKKTLILIVDDSAFFRKMISELLYVHQFRVLTATTGEDALTIFEQHPDIKLMITDYEMPGINGDELCGIVRKTLSKKQLAIIGISSAEDPQMAASFIKRGANDFIIKQSFLIEEFYSRVNQNMDLIHLLQESV